MGFGRDLALMAVGGAIGAGITYVVVTKKCNEQADKDLEAMQTYFRGAKKVSYAEVTPKEELKEEVEQVVSEAITATPQKSGIFAQTIVPTPEERVNYNQVVKTYTEVIETEKNHLNGSERFVYPNDDEYMASVEEYDLNDLEFFSDDGNCRDIDGDVYEATETLGLKWRDHLGEWVEGRCYVLDTVTKQGWEVMIQPGSYDDPVELRRYDPNNPDEESEE